MTTSAVSRILLSTCHGRHTVSGRTPRALYFNDDVFVGYCQDGEVLEISVADPQLGAVFYTLGQAWHRFDGDTPMLA